MNLRIEMYEKNCLRVLAAASSEQHCGIKKPHCFIGGKKLKNSIFKKVNTSFVKKNVLCIWVLSRVYAICSEFEWHRLDGLRISIEGTYWICVWRNSPLQHFWIQIRVEDILLIKAQHQKPRLHTSLFCPVLYYF